MIANACQGSFMLVLQVTAQHVQLASISGALTIMWWHAQIVIDWDDPSDMLDN
jgi:hypothetical protein